MLLHSYRIALILSCLADREKIRVVAKISDEICKVLPFGSDGRENIQQPVQLNK